MVVGGTVATGERGILKRSHVKKRHGQQERVLLVETARAAPGRVLGEEDNQNVEERRDHDRHPAQHAEDPVPREAVSDD